MTIASHNTFTYLPVRRWWMRPFAFMARCQREDFGMQWVYGARMFDLRIRFDDDMKPVICHGLIEYKHSDTFIYDILSQIKYGWVRVVLEKRCHDTYQEGLFKGFCRRLEKDYPNIYFFGGNNRSDWNCLSPIYPFKYRMDGAISHKYASATKHYSGQRSIMGYLDDLYPYLYAKKWNRENIKDFDNRDRWLMMDFVDIR